MKHNFFLLKFHENNFDHQGENYFREIRVGKSCVSVVIFNLYLKFFTGYLSTLQYQTNVFFSKSYTIVTKFAIFCPFVSKNGSILGTLNFHNCEILVSKYSKQFLEPNGTFQPIK